MDERSMTSDDQVRPVVFSTTAFRAADQIAAWREWFYPIFEISPVAGSETPFFAENKVWDIGGILLSRSVAPATHVKRGKLNISRNPVDHWVITYNRRGETSIATDRSSLHASAGVPFLWSLGERSSSERSSIDRIQLLIPRDMFREISSLLDASRGSVLNTPLGKMLGDYMIFLESRLCSVAAGDLPRLTEAVRSMIAACIAPSAGRSEVAAEEIELGRRERVCRVIHSQLRSPALTPAAICKSVGISRSQLYRLFEHSGGVQRYIKTQRLLQSHAILSDPDNMQSVLSIAESLCFEDASSFSRAFRREFGHSPSDAKSAAAAGMLLSTGPRRQGDPDTRHFADLLTVRSSS
jgi:AraC-like DNA-binding protein